MICRWVHRFALACVIAAVPLLGACGGLLPQPHERATVRDPRPATLSAALSVSARTAVAVYGVGKKGRPDAELAVYPAADAALHAPPDRLQDPTREPTATIGAGFLLSADGYIATAAHVVADADYVVVKLADQQVLRAELVGSDEEADVGLLKVDLSTAIAPVLGRSTALRAGDWVLALGDPYGLDGSVVAGIVGGTDRHFIEDGDLVYIQTDLPLNPGNSGGPLVDMSGAIVGMNSRILVGGYGMPGLSLAIPIEVVQQIAEELKSSGEGERPRLGAHFEDVSAPAALAAGRRYASGAVIKSVKPMSLAETVDLRVGDVVVGMNHQPIGDGADLVHALLAWRTARGTTFTVLRDGRYLELRLH